MCSTDAGDLGVPGEVAVVGHRACWTSLDHWITRWLDNHLHSGTKCPDFDHTDSPQSQIIRDLIWDLGLTLNISG